MSIISPQYGIHCGDASNMPPTLQNATGNLRERHRILYWSATDPTQPIQRGICCVQAGPLIMLPCFWPHLLILGGPFCCAAWCMKQDVLARYIVLTEATVEIIEVEHDKCCVPGCYRKGQEINSIPLDQINDIQTEGKASGCVTCCVPQFTEMRILTATNAFVGRRGQLPGLAIYAHTDVQELRNRIFSQRDIVRNGGNGVATAAVVQMIERDSGQQATEKLIALKNMLDSGLITEAEHDEKKKDILKSM